MSKSSDSVTSFLNDVAEQIAYKPLRLAVIKELQDHIEDRAEAFEAEGLSHDDALKKAVSVMGDAIAVGTEINAVRRVKTSPILVFLTAALMLSGLFARILMSLAGNPFENSYAFYLSGLLFLILVTHKGYPLLIKYQKQLLLLSAILLSLDVLCVLGIWRNEGLESLFPNVIFFPWYMVDYYTILLSGPAIAMLLYRWRKNPGKALTAAFFLTAGSLLFHPFLYADSSLAAAAVFLFSMIGTVCFMIRRAVITGIQKRLWLATGAASAVLITVFALLPGQADGWKAFCDPQAEADSMWTDAYNNVLIQELLKKASFVGPISLTPKEMQAYGTGEWYFCMDEASQAQAEGKKPYLKRNSYYAQNYLQSEGTLWDLLPQHANNNYLIAVSILFFGWLPGIVILTAIAAFYVVLFSCIRNIKGALAGSTAFYCGLCLLFQTVLYVLGNFGFQYANFTNLPLISEGSISILANTLLLGFIFSACRYDRVIDAPPCGQMSRMAI